MFFKKVCWFQEKVLFGFVFEGVTQHSVEVIFHVQ